MKKEVWIVVGVFVVLLVVAVLVDNYLPTPRLSPEIQQEKAWSGQEFGSNGEILDSRYFLPDLNIEDFEQRSDVFPYGEPAKNQRFLQGNVFVNGKLLKDEYDGWIIRGVEEPLAVTYAKNKLSKNLVQKINAQKNKIIQEQNVLKQRVRQLKPDVEVKNQFAKVLNAVVVDDLTPEVINALRSEGKIVTPNYRVYPMLMDSIPLINADDVWDLDQYGNSCVSQPGGGFEEEQPVPFIGSAVRQAPKKQKAPECITGKGVTIGIIDTGVDYTHPDLGGCFGEGCKVIGGYDFSDNDLDPMDYMGHGTHVAATAAGNGVLKGVAPDSKIVAYKVFPNSYDSVIIAAIERSTDPNNDGDFSDKLDVISLSLGGYGDPDDDMSASIDNAVGLGVVAVISAGNSGHTRQTIGSPGTARKAITVGAIDKNLGMADFSSGGPVVWHNETLNKTFGMIKPDIVAPGVSICAAQWNGWLEGQAECDPGLEGHIAISGTSMSAPHVSGLVALIKQRNPDYTPDEIKSVIKNTANLLLNPEEITTQGFGLIDALDSVFFDGPLVVNLDPIEQDKLIINISGEIIGNNFDYYSLSYAEKRPLINLNEEDWNLITTSSIIPNDGVLFGGFNLVSIPDGEHLIRLDVFDINGRKFEDYGYFIVDKFQFIEPLNHDIINPKNDLIIRLDNLFNLDIDSFIIEYSFEGGPWVSEGIIVNANLLEGQLEGDTLTDSGYLDIRAIITHGGIDGEIYLYNLYADTTLKGGWPVRVLYETYEDPYRGPSFYWSGFLETVVSDVNGDSQNEIIVYVGGDPPKIKIYNLDGNLISSFNVGPTGVAGGNLHHPLLADVDNDGLDEIVAYNFLSDSEVESVIYAFNYDGSIVSGWPVTLLKDYHPAIMAADLNLDGNIEVIVKGNGAIDEKLTIINNDGAILSQWDLPDIVIEALTGVPAVGNFDDDPELEIVVAMASENAGYDWVSNEFINEGNWDRIKA